MNLNPLQRRCLLLHGSAWSVWEEAFLALVKLCEGILQLEVRKQSNSAKICVKSIYLLLVSATFHFLIHTCGYFLCTAQIPFLHERTNSRHRQMFIGWAQPSLAYSASLSLLFPLNSLFAFLSEFLSLNWGESGIDQPAFHHSRAKGKDKEWKCWRKSLPSLTSQESQCPGSFFSFFPKKILLSFSTQTPSKPPVLPLIHPRAGSPLQSLENWTLQHFISVYCGLFEESGPNVSLRNNTGEQISSNFKLLCAWLLEFSELRSKGDLI